MRKRPDLTDSIQEACIAKMQALGLNANQIAERVGDRISRNHVFDYLGRRTSMGSHLLQHLLAALALAVNDERGQDRPRE